VKVAEETTFGRRRAVGGSERRAAVSAQVLSPEAEAFRVALEDVPTQDFSDWRRGQRSRRLIAWILSFVLLSPGVLCFLFQAPLPASIGLELAGMAVNGWLRRERRRHLRAVVGWEASTDAE
jgi:hypothetical protein